MSRRVDKEAAAHLQYETEHTEPPKSRSVIVYLCILVAAAFLLLLLAYVMQQRTSSTVENLQNGLNSFQTIDQLVDDNQALREETDALRAEREALRDELDSFKSSLADAEDEAQDNLDAFRQAEAERDALNILNQLRSLYNDRRYRDAQELLAANPGLETTFVAIHNSLSAEELEVYDPLASFQRLVRLLT